VISFSGNNLAQLDNNYTFTDDCFIEETIQNRTIVKWTDVKKVVENKKLIAVYISYNLAYLFPKNQLSANEIATIRLILAKSLDKRVFR
jgi:hypothetical protein